MNHSDRRLECRGWAVEFLWTSDRFGHRVWRLAAQTGPRLVWCSVEGTADEAWPPSPPLQQLHCEERPGGEQVALLVGLAGRSHWSLAVSLDPQSDSVAFEVACRLHDSPQWLGSTYLEGDAGGGDRPLAAGPLAVGQPPAGGPGSVRVDATGFASPARVVTPVGGGGLAWRLEPSDHSTLLPRTVCWSYRLTR